MQHVRKLGESDVFAVAVAMMRVDVSGCNCRRRHAKEAQFLLAGSWTQIPMVEPRETSLHFPPNPTSQDIFCARVFEEPFVPIGAEPTAAENAALADALALGLSRQTGPAEERASTGSTKAAVE